VKLSQADSQVRFFRRTNVSLADSLFFFRVLKSLGTQHVWCSCKDAIQYGLLGRPKSLSPFGSRPCTNSGLAAWYCYLFRTSWVPIDVKTPCWRQRERERERERENRFLKGKTLCWRQKGRDRYSLAETPTDLEKTTRLSALEASIPFCRYMTQV
jgi:hypothetical protein